MTVSKFCKRCGKMMWDVSPCKRFCDKCVREKDLQKSKERYAKKKAMRQGVISDMQAGQPAKGAQLKRRIKSIPQCVKESAALGISYGQYVQRGYDKEVL